MISEGEAPVLEAAVLGVERGGRWLFRCLGLRLLPGQVVWLRGRNGSGKTTLLRLMAGLAEPSTGAVLCNDGPIGLLEPDWRRRLLFLGHANALKDDMTVAEALSFSAAIHGRRPSAEALGTAMRAWGLWPARGARVRALSQGQRRRVALARLHLPQPPSVWLLDEPFDALDEAGIRTLCAALAAHAARGGSALLTSHQAFELLHWPVHKRELSALDAQP